MLCLQGFLFAAAPVTVRGRLLEACQALDAEAPRRRAPRPTVDSGDDHGGPPR